MKYNTITDPRINCEHCPCQNFMVIEQILQIYEYDYILIDKFSYWQTDKCAELATTNLNENNEINLLYTREQKLIQFNLTWKSGARQLYSFMNECLK
jgi:hypothetical protein